ncbi:hypothetical protein OH809_10910 [Streptomyces sp. NBC_00873]|uniref:hypothetical protein n=1 Tax=unclassified Streptomyces TaxID=2593676 RepID=UPI0038640795|nr:hypothetical protein OH809_10910 [Streptomyces sp. NBC_00873]WTA46838.1 hypothetical protein OH821_32905 [Streptomyces sp. NBC_00842]
MFAASGLVRALGPAQTPMTAEMVATQVEALDAALRSTMDGKVDGALLERARSVHRASLADYLGRVNSQPGPDSWLPASSVNLPCGSSSTALGSSSCCSSSPAP